MVWHQFISQSDESLQTPSPAGMKLLPQAPAQTSSLFLNKAILLHRSTPEPCSTFQHLLIGFMCGALTKRKKKKKRWTALLSNSRKSSEVWRCRMMSLPLLHLLWVLIFLNTGTSGSQATIYQTCRISFWFQWECRSKLLDPSIK